MREILFRGKRIDIGEWVYGYYSKHSTGKIFIRETGKPCTGSYEVDPHTVGQYTGLTAKGKKIFEGDIVKYRVVDAVIIKISGDDEKSEFIGPVKYINGSFLYVTNSKEEIEVRAVYEEDGAWEAEVIGNIHDNPELLEGNDG